MILHADHILPVVKGGTDDLANLITSCSECNLGKAARLLGDRPQALSSAQETEHDRFDQLREYNEWLAERAVVKEDWFQQISTVWIILDRADPSKWVISGQRASTVRMFLDRLPAQEIIDALHITNGRHPDCSDQPHFFKYFCGVCWNKVKKFNPTSAPTEG